jgi:hypothetical protein
MGIEPPPEAWESFANFFEPTPQRPSGGRQPLEPNGQTFGPLPSPESNCLGGNWNRFIVQLAWFAPKPTILDWPLFTGVRAVTMHTSPARLIRAEQAFIGLLGRALHPLAAGKQNSR